jgi:antitoxin component YwqK of YwqJK toxin-antitoxin module
MDELTSKMYLNVQVFYKDEIETARWYYNDNGTIKKEGKKISGVVRMYHPNNMLASEMSYKNGELDGHYLLLSEAGKVEEEGSFKNNELDGTYRQYHETGGIKLEGRYRKGKKEGIFRLYYASGMLEEEETHKKGVLDGEVKEYYENGRPLAQAYYKKGKLVRLRQYDEAGNLKKEEKF